MIKINWGSAIVIAFVLFIGFILYFVVRASTDSSLNHDLVIEDYYGQELHFNEQFEAEKLGNTYLKEILFSTSSDGLYIEIDSSIKNEINDVEVFCYRPSNKNLDFTEKFGHKPSTILIPTSKLIEGVWEIELRWNSHGNAHLIKKNIQI